MMTRKKRNIQLCGTTIRRLAEKYDITPNNVYYRLNYSSIKNEDNAAFVVEAIEEDKKVRKELADKIETIEGYSV